MVMSRCFVAQKFNVFKLNVLNAKPGLISMNRDMELTSDPI